MKSAVDWQGGGHVHQNWPSIEHVADAFIFPGDDPVDYNSAWLSITPGQILDLANAAPGGGSHMNFYVMIDVLYGENREYETKVCKVFQVVGDLTKELRLGGLVVPCSEKNYAK